MFQNWFVKEISTGTDLICFKPNLTDYMKLALKYIGGKLVTFTYVPFEIKDQWTCTRPNSYRYFILLYPNIIIVDNFS